MRVLPKEVKEAVVLCSRRFGKCLKAGTEVMTPRGPVPIEKLTVGQSIYGYEDGQIIRTTVLAIENQGEKEVVDLIKHNKVVTSSTLDHRFQSSLGDVRALKEWRSRDKLSRRFVRAPLGYKRVKEAYAIGAMLGNGCMRQSTSKQIHISCDNIDVPNKVASIFNGNVRKQSIKNYTYVISCDKIDYPFKDWYFGKLSYDKSIDLEEIKSWDRRSQLELLAGLIDTDGSVTSTPTGSTIRFNSSSEVLCKGFSQIVYHAFQIKIPVLKYKRSQEERIEYLCSIKSNLHVRRIISELDGYLVNKKRKITEFGCPRNDKEDVIGVKFSEPYKAICYDIQVSNPSSLYMLANEGVITHNSYLGVVMALEDCIRNEGVIVRIISENIKHATAIVVPLINKIIKDAPEGLVVRTKSESKWKIGKSELILGGFDTATLETHRGSEAYSIYIEESRNSHPDQYLYAVREVLKPQLLHTRGRMYHMTTPPSIPAHPFLTDTVPLAKENNAFFRYTIFDNPLLDEMQINDAIRDCGGEDTTAFKIEYLAQIIRDSNILVIPEFNKDIHSFEFPNPEHAVYQTAIDFGGVRDKTVGLLMTYDFKQAKDLVIDERMFPINTSTKLIVQELKEMEKGYNVEFRYGDSSGQTLIDSSYTHDYLFNRPLKDDFDSSINNVRLRVQQGKVLVHPRCKFLINTLESGMFNKTRTDFLRTEFLGHNDAIMALAYGLRMLDRSTNPYPPEQVSNENRYVPPSLQAKQEFVNLAQSMNSKRFGTFRR